MFITKNAGVNEKGKLSFGGIDTVELAEKYATPLYVVTLDGVKESCREFIKALNLHYEGNGKILYASKANCNVQMCATVANEGLGIDVVSGGELYTALKAGVAAENIFFHGNNKTNSELEYAIDSNVGRIFADNFDEIEYINELAKEKNKKVNILIRVNPGIDANTHDYIKTGNVDSKFGFSIQLGDATRAVLLTLSCENVNLCGIDCHIGSQVFERQPFIDEARVLVEFLASLRELTGVTLKELNLGGGFGVQYKPDDDPIDPDIIIKTATDSVKDACKTHDFPLPYLMFEPGRAIVANNGLTLYTVGNVKEIAGVRNYVQINGGMFDNPRHALYGAKYEMCVANRASLKRDYVCAVAGKCCESGDLIDDEVNIQNPNRGDTLAVFTTGAYNYSMASNYNRNPRPATVFIDNGIDRLGIKRETYEDLVRNDI